MMVETEYACHASQSARPLERIETMGIAEVLMFCRSSLGTAMLSLGSIIFLFLTVVHFDDLTGAIPYPYGKNVPATMLALALSLSTSFYESRLGRRMFACALVAGTGYFLAPVFPKVMILGIVSAAALTGSLGDVKLTIPALLLIRIVRLSIGVGALLTFVSCLPFRYVGAYGERLIESSFRFLIVVFLPVFVLFAFDTMARHVFRRASTRIP